jgi:hypothetical protein
MNSLYWNHNMQDVEGAYIIRIKDHEKSEELANRCAYSCDRVGQQYKFWDAYDGTKENIAPPDHHNDTMSMIKITNHYLTRAEIACALSHISLWVKCVLLDKPIVILEHDAIMVQPYTSHNLYNSICYLGGIEQAKHNWQVKSIPPHATDGPNFHFICRAHAYAIDPLVAKNMVAHVLKMGIHVSLDMMLRADLFPIHQIMLYAYDNYADTTIPGRPAGGRNIIKNDDLKV